NDVSSEGRRLAHAVAALGRQRVALRVAVSVCLILRTHSQVQRGGCSPCRRSFRLFLHHLVLVTFLLTRFSHVRSMVRPPVQAASPEVTGGRCCLFHCNEGTDPSGPAAAGAPAWLAVTHRTVAQERRCLAARPPTRSSPRA